MSSRKLNSRPITDFFARSEVSNDENRTNAAAGRMVPMTATKELTTMALSMPYKKPKTQDDKEGAANDVTTSESSSSASSSLSLVATPLCTGPSSRLVTTQKKRKEAPLSSTDTTPSVSSFFPPRMTVKATTPLCTGPSSRLVTTQKKRKEAPLSSTDTTPSVSSFFPPRMTVKASSMNKQEAEVPLTEDDEEGVVIQPLTVNATASANLNAKNETNTNKTNSWIVAGNITVRSPNGKESKSRATSNRCSPLEPLAPYVSFQDDLSIAASSKRDSSQDDDDDDDDDDDEGEEEEEEEEEGNEETDGTDFRPIEIVGEVNARKIIKPFCVQSANILKEENFFETPFGKLATHLKKRTMTCNSGVYCILSADGTTISKIGSTKNFQRRYRLYQEQYNIEEKQFFIMVDFSSTNEKVDQRLNETYLEMMDVLAKAQHLDPFQRFLADALIQRGGDRLGMKEVALLQMIEIGLQYQYQLAVVSEFVLFSPGEAQRLYNVANNEAERLMQHLTIIRSKIGNGETISLQAICSWMSGVKYMSSKIVTTHCILGERFQDQYIDTLPFPPVDTTCPKNWDDWFDTSKYTDQDKEEGRGIFYQTVKDFLLKDHGVLFVDSNKLILDNDPNCRISAHTILTEHFQLIYTERFLEGEIVLYLDEHQSHAVVLHNPVCVASDARRCISHELRWKRGLAVATLCNVGRLVRGERVLSPEDRFFNPIHAMLAFYIIIHGYHCGPIQAAAFYRDFVTPETTNALLYNGLLKTAENGPVAKRMRRKYIGARGREYIERLENGDKVRRHDSRIMNQARSMTSQHPENSSEEDLGAYLISLFDSYPSLRSRNFKYFINKHLSSPLKDNLLQIWEANTANRGNRTTGPNKAVTRLRVSNNDDSVAELLTTHGPNNGKLEGRTFWIKTSHEVVTRPAHGTPSTKPSIIFPDGKLVYDDFCLEGLRERFKERERQDTCHNTVQAIRYSHFQLKTCMVYSIDSRNRFAISCEGYTLVYIVVAQKSKPVESIASNDIVVPLDQHSSTPIRLFSHWANDCVVCVAKADQQYPGMKRKEMRRKKLLRKSRYGCPDCDKGKGVSVCTDCWKAFDHQL